MYYCNNCGEFTYGKWSDELYIDVCTVCGSENIEKASKCKEDTTKGNENE